LQIQKIAVGDGCEFCVGLIAINGSGDPRNHSGRVAGAGTNIEHTVVACDFSQL
jgi:hypothetical protein